MTQDGQPRADDLAFLADVRDASLPDLYILRRALALGAPAWQREAVERAVRRRVGGEPEA